MMWLGVLRTILYTLAALVVWAMTFGAGIFLARHTLRPLGSLELPSTPPEQLQHAKDLLEKALAARFAGDNAKAIQLFDEASATDDSLKGLDYQRGICFLQQSDFTSAETAANASLAKNEETANAYALLMMCAAGRAGAGETTDPKQVEGWLRDSRAKDPLGPFVHYAMGEYLRATGRPREAVESYRKALERVSRADSFLVATVKAGLSGLRLRQDSDPKLVAPAAGDQKVPPEQLFLAAGQALLDGDRPAARSSLNRARQVVPTEVFAALLQDSFFQDYLPEGISNDPQQSDPP